MRSHGDRDDPLPERARGPVAPGLPRALSRTLGEIRLAAVVPERLLSLDSAELLWAHQAYEAELREAGVADRALVFRLAAEVARGASARGKGSFAASGIGGSLGQPLLLLDVPSAVCARAAAHAAGATSPPTSPTPSSPVRRCGHGC